MAAEIARESIAAGADLILAAGGDGTINEVANGMIHSKTPLGILPGGTANVLATEMGLGRTMDRAAKRVSECTPEVISVGHLHSDGGATSRYFLMMAGVGLDAHIVYHLNLGLKASLGKLAYWISGFTNLGRRLPLFDVEVGDHKVTTGFALASRVRNYGGDLEIARTASLLDHDFEVVLFEGAESLRYLKYLLAVAAHRHKGIKGVSVLRSQALKFNGSADRRIYVQVDGEFAGHLPARVEIVEKCLTLLLPPEFRRKMTS